MARNAFGGHNTVATGSDSGDQVSVNAWNTGHDQDGMLGFTPSTKTIATGKITPADTATVVAAESSTADNLDLITYSETSANDLLYLFADSGDTITVRHNQSPGSGEAAIITTSAGSITLSETIPLVLQRRGTTFYQIIENSISTVTASSTTTFTNKSIDLTDNTLTGTSAELKTAISDETGSGSLVFATSPTLVTPALGTPASGVLTNATGTASSLTAGNVTTNANLTGGVTSVGNAATVVTNANLTGDVTSTGNATAIASGVIVNADINSSAAVAYSKLSLTGAILNADLAGSIAPSKVTGTAAILGANTFTGAQDLGGNNLDNIQNLIHDLTTTASVSGAQTLDFNADQLETWALSGSTAITFATTSNKAVGRSKTIRLVNDGTAQDLTLHSSWKIVGTAPSDIAASKTGILTLTCFGTAETDIVAAYAVEA